MSKEPEALEPVPAPPQGRSQEGEKRGQREVRQDPGRY